MFRENADFTDDSPVATYGVHHYQLTDVQFSPVAVVNGDNGLLEERISYNAYGQPYLTARADVNATAWLKRPILEWSLAPGAGSTLMRTSTTTAW